MDLDVDGQALARAVDTGDEEARVRDADVLRQEVIGPLARLAALGEGQAQRTAQHLIRALARDLGVQEASIQPLYRARGRGEVAGFTVPAMNLRCMTYTMARAAFRAAAREDVGALVFELARSEMRYTDQSPAAYASAVLAAAIREGHEGPVFLQGDHFQVDPDRFADDPAGERRAIRDLVTRSLDAGFLNIDVDASTLVDLSLDTVEAQQRANAAETVGVLSHVRSEQPVPVSVGGEVGEVGAENTTEAELRAFLDQVEAGTSESWRSMDGPSKVSVQTGTQHGGVVRPDGSLAEVDVDVDTLERLSRVAREEYGLAGCVQHGASTLPKQLFERFPAVEAAEIHLATGFQNLVLDHEAFPDELRDELYTYLDQHLAERRKPDATDEQFRYRNRKRALGAFKTELWTLDPEARRAIGADLEDEFAFLFDALGVDGTRTTVDEHVDPPVLETGPPPGGTLHLPTR
jgi:fructose/tagatose bisphosphate aldolase